MTADMQQPTPATATQTAPQQLTSQPAVLRATIQITRAKTGKVEEYTIVGTPTSEEGA